MRTSFFEEGKLFFQLCPVLSGGSIIDGFVETGAALLFSYSEIND